MKVQTCSSRPNDGIALIIVMLVILTLGILAGGFAYSMKVESRLARNTSFEPDLEWLGRSGVELARYVLSQQMKVREEPWDSLNQKWAGGPGGTNEALAAISLEDNTLGNGQFSIEIVDLERKFNANMLSGPILQRALEFSGVDPTQLVPLVDAYLDWRDPDDTPRLDGAETAHYLREPNPGFPPYVAKNGPIDHLYELLMIRGITPEAYWGGFTPSAGQDRSASRPLRYTGQELDSGATGLAHILCTLSIGRVNVNTASAAVLQLVPGLDEGLAQGIIATRAGLDSTDGTEDDIPFRSPGELINVPGMDRAIVTHLQTFFTTRSYTFEVTVDARIGEYRRQYRAVLRRNNERDIQILYFHWL